MTQKDQMEKKCASERLRKNKKRKLRARMCDSNIEKRDRVPCVSAYNECVMSLHKIMKKKLLVSIIYCIFAFKFKRLNMNFKKKRWHCLPGQPLTELDKQVMYWENKGKEVPTRDLIKTPEQIEGIRIASKVNTGCLDAVAAAIHPGMSTQEIDDICMQYCKDNNAVPACLGYEGFPKSVCTSINEVVCHGIPKEEDILKEGDIVNVDMTLSVNGYFGDASRMFIIGGKTTPEKEQLVRVAKECLDIGAEAAKPYCFVGDIGHAIQKHAEKYHYGVVRDLCGHGVGLAMHEEPDVVHYGHRGTGMLLVPGMVFTIEPMINMGTWKVFIDADDPYGWEVISGDEKPSAQWEHTFLMTETGVEVLSY